MSILPASGIGDESTGFYPQTVNQSLRFNKADTPYLERTFVTPSSTRKVIIATWIKPTVLGSTTPVMYSAPTSLTTSYFLMGFAQASYIDSNDSFKIFTVEGNSAKVALRTDRRFRDTNAWMHVCVAIDTTQATSTDRVLIFFNGKRYTGTYDTYNTFPSQNHDFTVMNSAIKHRIGATSNGLHANYGNLNGYLSEFYFIDGQSMFSDTSGTINSTFLADANTLATFCEQKNGVAVPKSYSGTFGNNGCRLTFEGTGTATTSQGTTAQTNIGDDQSGEGHNFSVNGLATTDVVSDSPTNNFAVLGELNSDSNSNILEGGLRATMGGSGNYDQVRSDFGLASGKWYWEVLVEERGYIPSIGVMAGYTGPSDNPTHWVTFGFGQWHITYNSGLPKYNVNQNSGGGTNWGVTMPANDDIVMVAIDVDNNKIWWGLNGTWYNSSGTANPATGTDARVTLTSDQTWHPILTLDTGASSLGASNAKMRMNFGQDSTFQGAKSAGSNADGNGNGLFQYAPPSGYLACCTDNLPDLTFSPAQSNVAGDFFNVVTYDGDGNSTNDVTGIGFKPDITWIKETNGTSHWAYVDSSRGYENFNSFSDNIADSTGVTNNNSTRTNDSFQTTASGATNENGKKYISYNWKVNDATEVSNSEGTVTGNVQVNTDAGISIIRYTGTGTDPSGGGVTIGHGLNKKPEFIHHKNRVSTTAGNNYGTWWSRFHSGTNMSFSAFDSNNTGGWNGSPIDEDVLTPPISNYGNVNGDTYFMYAWHSVEGFSKVGNYYGNGTTDNTFVFTGFSPKFIIIKNISSGHSWTLRDTLHGHYYDTDGTLGNPINIGLRWKAEVNTGGSAFMCDFLSNGFKFRNYDADIGANNNEYIYLAMAEQPFKFSNGR